MRALNSSLGFGTNIGTGMGLCRAKSVVPPALRRRRWNSQFPSHESTGPVRSVGCDESDSSSSSLLCSIFLPVTHYDFHYTIKLAFVTTKSHWIPHIFVYIHTHTHTHTHTELTFASKGKGQPRTGHEGPEGENRYSSTLSLTSVLDGGGWGT